MSSNPTKNDSDRGKFSRERRNILGGHSDKYISGGHAEIGRSSQNGTFVLADEFLSGKRNNELFDVFIGIFK
jgi:hypothetical protein